MKKNMLLRMFAAALSVFVIVGCGNTAETIECGSVVTGEEDADVEKDTEVEEETEETELEPVNWLEEHEIAITPQGDCTVTLYSYEEDYVDDFLADVNVTITETTEGVEEGLKKITASYVLDVSNDPGNGVMWHNSVFDRG